MSKLRDILNGVSVDGANTFGAEITGIEPITPNAAEILIKLRVLEIYKKTIGVEDELKRVRIFNSEVERL